MRAAPEPNARVAWLESLLGERWDNIRELERAIKDSNGGHGPSHTTLINLLDRTRRTKVEEHTIAQIAAFFRQDPADVERQLDITLSPGAVVMLLAARTEGLRDTAMHLAALPDDKREAFQTMIRKAAANTPITEPSSHSVNAVPEGPSRS